MSNREDTVANPTGHPKVEALKKIRLWIDTGEDPDRLSDTSAGSMEFEFVFGLGGEGMTPFEYELIDKKPGDSILIHVARSDLHHQFEHLCTNLAPLFPDRESFYLKAVIREIIQADSREIVKAMASMHGCGDDCGCGCCGHG